MKVADFDYDLPADLIAQTPARPRDSSRLLVVHRSRGEIEHRAFRDLADYLTSRDIVVFNDTRVIRARLRGRREPGGGKAEVLLLSEQEGGLWEALVTPGRRLPPGREIVFGEGELRAEVLSRTPSGGRILRFSPPGLTQANLARFGELPLPPYIRHPLEQTSDYQTVYARALGSSAAPTAGLHFTREMVEAVRERAGGIADITLHIGVATFRPIRTEDVADHDMHPESYAISEANAGVISEAVAAGDRVVAVGTSTARALETATAPDGRVLPGAGRTELFIRPGYVFGTIGALLTNFHLPRSTLLLLVCALAGRELMLEAYREAVELRYRFLSFGDAMLIV